MNNQYKAQMTGFQVMDHNQTLSEDWMPGTDLENA